MKHVSEAFDFIVRRCPDAKMDTWTDDQDNDVPAISTHDYVLWIQKDVRLDPESNVTVDHWRVQGLIHWEDRSVGIFGAIDPGDVVLSTTDYISAIEMFVLRSMVNSLDEALVDLYDSEREKAYDEKRYHGFPPSTRPHARRAWLREQLAMTDHSMFKTATKLIADGHLEGARNVLNEVPPAWKEDPEYIRISTYLSCLMNEA